MTLQPSRRSFITGLVSLAVTAIVRASSLMPVKAMVPELVWFQDHYRWDMKLASDDWRYAARIVNIDVTVLPGNANLIGLLTRERYQCVPIIEFDKIDTSDPLWAMRCALVSRW